MRQCLQGKDRYSDVGFILLGLILELCCGRRLDVQFADFLRQESSAGTKGSYLFCNRPVGSGATRCRRDVVQSAEDVQVRFGTKMRQRLWRGLATRVIASGDSLVRYIVELWKSKVMDDWRMF